MTTKLDTRTTIEMLVQLGLGRTFARLWSSPVLGVVWTLVAGSIRYGWT